MIKKETLPSGDRMLITFEYAAAVRAASVHLVGDFNNWNETATLMKLNARRAVWSVQIELERGNHYEFRYLVDGVSWHNDWHANSYSPNIHGSDNSVVST